MQFRLLLSAVVLCFSFISASADITEKVTGIWQGKLNIQGVSLRIVFHINSEEGKLMGTMDSPDQGALGIPITEILLFGDSIKISIDPIGYYIGKIDTAAIQINGSWIQGGNSLPLDLAKTEKVEEIKRPQTPKEPFPYNVEDVVFKNEKDNIMLAGTLTVPKTGKDFPVVVFVSGSGPQDRDESLLNHKPFWVLADFFSRNGIAVLRYDDRGTAKSEGDFKAATTLDFVQDALAAVNFIGSREELKAGKLGILGHSEGGLIAPLAAQENENIDFIILLAGPALPGDEILYLQSGLIAKAAGADEAIIERDQDFSTSIYEILKSDVDTAEAASQISVLFREYYESLSESEKSEAGDLETVLAQNLKVINSPWFRYFVSYDPRPVLEKTTVPILALFGEKDLQVPAPENKEAMEKALSNNNPKNKIIIMQGLNHLFQTANSGSPTEYATIEETFSADAAKVTIEWIHSLKNQ